MELVGVMASVWTHQASIWCVRDSRACSLAVPLDCTASGLDYQNLYVCHCKGVFFPSPSWPAAR